MHGIAALFIPVLILVASAASPQDAPGPVAAWQFTEGQGDIARDGTGNGNDGRLHGPTWVKRGDGYALSFDGIDDYVDCGAAPGLDIRQAVSVEAWAKPTNVPNAEPMIVGKFYESYGLTMYKDGGCWWYISGGGNNLKAPLQVGQWHHIVGAFDGTTMTLWVDRRMVGRKASPKKTINPGKNLLMGALSGDPTAADPAYKRSAHWRGELDAVRIYNRALTADEVQTHYKTEAAGYGVDTTWFDRVRLWPYVFRSERKLAILCDYSDVFPLKPDAKVQVSLVAGQGGQEVHRREATASLRDGRTVVEFPLTGLEPGTYEVIAQLAARDDHVLQARYKFSMPLAPVAVGGPDAQRVPKLRPPPGPAPYNLQMHEAGGFSITAAGRHIAFESSYSFPNGGENRLSAGSPDASGEAQWQVKELPAGDDLYEVTARGRYYSVARKIRLINARILVTDTIRNETDDDLGIILDNHLDASDEPFTQTAVAGYPNGPDRRYADSPSTFVAWDDLGVGMLPLDDVYVIQSTVYAREGKAGIRTDEFALGPRASYTLQWAVYPCRSNSYYDFINQVRRDESRVGTVEGGFAFIPRENVSPAHVALRGLSYGSFGCLTKVADDPEIEIEGIEFIELPKERARIREQFAAIRKANPGLKLMFHVAHSLWSTNKPQQTFSDSRVIDAAGNHVIYSYNYDACTYFSRRRHEEGWRWYIYYPTPGNSFHDALMHSVDVMMDDIGCDGVFMDGFMFGYGARYTYDRWDGHTADIDPETKTIKRKKASVLLLSQPSMAEFTRRMQAKGGVVVANNAVMTRSIAELGLIVDQEIRSGPDVHLSPTSASLGNPAAINGEADVYRDVLDKLRWGNLYFYYGEGALTYPSLPQRMYPITVQELYSGTIKGEERIITMHSGVYGWPGSKDLHQSFRYNAVGLPVPAEFLTRVDADGVRTMVRLQTDETAVVTRVPLSLETDGPVNLILEGYDSRAIHLSLNGRAQARLVIANGEFPVAPGAELKVTGAAPGTVRADAESTARVPLAINGPARVVIVPAGAPKGPN